MLPEARSAVLCGNDDDLTDKRRHLVAQVCPAADGQIASVWQLLVHSLFQLLQLAVSPQFFIQGPFQNPKGRSQSGCRASSYAVIIPEQPSWSRHTAQVSSGPSDPWATVLSVLIRVIAPRGLSLTISNLAQCHREKLCAALCGPWDENCNLVVILRLTAILQASNLWRILLSRFFLFPLGVYKYYLSLGKSLNSVSFSIYLVKLSVNSMDSPWSLSIVVSTSHFISLCVTTVWYYQ